ncbi:MAG: 50S ribosomal protein L22 [Candidatus Thermoplasmatota archaeon]|jgi:large subunit ribosomal protein L22|nr:50S ribosomal protein L22 [Candidatus Thermoplasmatota archaeon]
MKKYSTTMDPDKTAKAYGYELHCSVKDSRNIAHAIKGMKVEEAKKYLEDVIAMKRNIPTIYHKGKRSHQKASGPASFPRKAAEYMLKTIKNAENNAEYKGFDTENMKISHISAYNGRIIKGMTPRAHGRATDKNETTTNIEIILEEVE